MSNTALTWAWKVIRANRDLTVATRLVLLSLADRADKLFQSWPGVERIASDCNLSCVSVRSALTLLVKSGLIKRQRRTNENGGSRTNIYTLCIENTQPVNALSPGGNFVSNDRGKLLNPNPNINNPKYLNDAKNNHPGIDYFDDGLAWRDAENLLETSQHDA